jgi:hypothetical protein
MKYKIVLVAWVDSVSTFGWREPNDHGPAVIMTSGFLVREDSKSISVSTSVGRSGNCLDQLCIPRACIQSIKQIANCAF